MAKLIFLTSLVLASFNNLEAHELNPARLTLDEVETNSFEVVWRFPSNVLTKPGSVVYPSNCQETVNSLPEIEGKYLISIQFFDGGQFEGLVSVNNPKITIPGESNLYPTNYFWLGVEHLLSGIDHLIFVLGLIFIVVGFKTLIKTITAFTIAHSITLALSVTNTFQLPQSSAGFGFAGALSEIGFSDSSLLYSLLFFNLGIEAGQLLVLPFFVLIVWLFNRVKITNFIYQFSSYLIGGIACFWLIERITKIVI